MRGQFRELLADDYITHSWDDETILNTGSGKGNVTT